MDVSKIDFEDTSQDETLGDRLANKAKRSPFLVASLVGLVTVCGIGAYKWKTRTSTQMYLLQLRVAAQGTAVACLSLGMIYHMCKDFLFVEKKDK